MKLNRFSRDTLISYLFLFPFLVVFGIFLFYPIIYSLILSFHSTSIYSDLFNVFADMEFVGLKNYVYLLHEADFWWSLLLTFYYAILYIPANIFLSLLLALLLTNQLRGKTFFRSAFFLPNVLDMLVIGIIWTLIYAPKYGLLALIGKFLHSPFLSESGVLAGSWTVLPAISMAMVLKNAGFGMILYLTAIQNISPTIYEAADLDGAGWWSKLKHITWPLVKPITIFLVVTGTLMSLNAFTEIYAMTRDGSPTVSPTLPTFGEVTVGASRISGFYLFQEFERGRYGVAAAISYILLIIAVTVSIINVKFLQPKKVK